MNLQSKFKYLFTGIASSKLSNYRISLLGTLTACLFLSSYEIHKTSGNGGHGHIIIDNTPDKNHPASRQFLGLIALDTSNINNSKNEFVAARYFYKTGDSINWLNDTIPAHWQQNLTRVNSAYVWYMIPVNVSSSLIGVPVCFNYDYMGPFEVYLNGRLLFHKGNVAKQQNYENINEDDKYFYLVFTKPNNFLIIRTGELTGSKLYDYYGFFRFSIQSETQKRKTLQSTIKSNSISDVISVSLGIFYFTFFFLYLILYFSDKSVKVNFYFSLLCLFIFLFFLLNASFLEPLNSALNTAFNHTVALIVAFLFYVFVCFLHQLVFGGLRKYLRWLFGACSALALFIIFAPSDVYYTSILYDIAIFIIAAFATIDGIRVVIIGLKNKTRGIKAIIRGIFLSMILSIVSLIIIIVSKSDDIGFFSWAISLSVIPLSVAITLVNNYTKTGKLLALELNRVKQLSAITMQQEKEKQEILESQKEKLEEQVVVRTAEIVRQKDEIARQKELVESKNKDILDSIAYAKRLQDAILPPVSLIQTYFPDSFVLYKPKDIVAGDFYWMEREGDLILLAACDCTGHGVPGALVSVVCSNALNRSVKEFGITDPGKILDKVRELVLETFEKSENDVKDGMDVSLLAISYQPVANGLEIQWSGAYNPLWYISGGNLHEVKADKQPIGKYDFKTPFKTHSLKLQKGDCLYLFTDGYADQFGGPKGKKFKYIQLQEKLLAINQQPLYQQKAELEKKLESWKGELEQVDDILIIGIRI
ncbi:MAG: SpoIIE family protein phosphatase [Bacteroidia bacterium]|nr:SpoIIE family protein phosphatase [Bacteroidia bacterium]